MYEVSSARITRLTLAMGAVGAVVALAGWNYREAAGFLAGAALSLVSVHSWLRVAAMLDPDAPGAQPGAGWAVLLALRYVLIGGAVYATMKLLGSTPAAILIGLLVSFAAVVLDFLLGTVRSK